MKRKPHTPKRNMNPGDEVTIDGAVWTATYHLAAGVAGSLAFVRKLEKEPKKTKPENEQ